MKARIAYLDGWRALAIGAVITSHFGRGWGGWLGDYGVELFFALSGLLMADILFVKPTPVGPFIVRRLTRVYPAMIVFIAAMAGASLLGTLAGVMPAAMQLTWGQVLAATTFVTGNYYSYTGLHSVLGHTWSLGVEVAAYTILAAIAAMSRRPGTVVPAILAISVFLAILGIGLLRGPNYGWESVYWRIDVRVPSVLFPVALFLMLRNFALPAFVSPLGFFAAAIIFRYGDPISKHTLGTICVALSVCSLSSTFNWIKRGLSLAPLTWIGTISYSLYLWQQPFWKVAAKGPWWASVVGAVIALPVAAVSYRYCELAAEKWLRHRLLPPPAAHSEVDEADLAPVSNGEENSAL